MATKKPGFGEEKLEISKDTLVTLCMGVQHMFDILKERDSRFASDELMTYVYRKSEEVMRIVDRTAE